MTVPGGDPNGSQGGRPPEERIARLQLARSRNVGSRAWRELMRRYGSAERALEALPTLARRGGNRAYAAQTREDAEREVEAGLRVGATLILLGDPDYPPLLTAIDNPPPALWIKGARAVLRRDALAVVGARNASALGLRTARRIVAGLVGNGPDGPVPDAPVIVSGLARGIDAAAHEAALETGTIAVTAGGIDRTYPPEHADLADRIAERGCLLSEFAVGTEPAGRNFPRRNRLISGLARGVLLIEAAARSGSLITARYALEHGREVMACPGAPEDPRAGGCNALIRDGAALIRDAEDVREALDAPGLLPGCGDGGGEATQDDLGETRFDGEADGETRAPTERALTERVLTLLGPHPVETDALARECGATPADLAPILLELELAGRIHMLPGGAAARPS